MGWERTDEDETLELQDLTVTSTTHIGMNYQNHNLF